MEKKIICFIASIIIIGGIIGLIDKIPALFKAGEVVEGMIKGVCGLSLLTFFGRLSIKVKNIF